MQNFFQLSREERSLLVSSFFFSIATPIFLVFTNTFLWRSEGSTLSIVIYNAGIYAGVALGFIANRSLLLKFSPRFLYSLGCLMQGLVPIALVLIAPQHTSNIVGLGLASGFASGLYYANKNYFLSLFTQGKNRLGFLSLDQASSVVSGVLSPLIIGWYLTATLHGSSAHSLIGYTYTALAGFVFLAIAAITINIPRQEPQTRKHLFVQNASAAWNRVRLMDFFGGVGHGMQITIPLLVTLALIPTEQAVGGLQSAATLIGVLSLYALSKKRRRVPYVLLMSLWVGVSLVAGVLIGDQFTPWSVIVAAILTGIVNPIQRTTTAHIMFNAVDREDNRERANFLLDREIFLDVGRVVGLSLCAVAILLAPTATVRYGSVVIVAVYAVYSVAAIRATK